MGIITLIVGSGFLIFAAITGFIIFIGIILLLVYLYRNWGTLFPKNKEQKALPKATVKPAKTSAYINDLKTFAEDLKNSLLIPKYKTDYLNSIHAWLGGYVRRINETIPLELDVSNPQLNVLMENLNQLSKVAYECLGELAKNDTILNEFA
jgi:hypothetical protein